MATGFIPPPPPPPPIPTVGGPKIQHYKSNSLGASANLSRGSGPTTNSNNIGSVRSPVPQANRRPLDGVDDEILQRAAQRLRKTVNSQSVYAPEQEQHVGRSPVVSSGGHWPNNSEYATVAKHSAGESVFTSDVSPYSSTQIGFVHGRPIPIKQQPSALGNSSSSNNYTITTNYNSAPPPLPSQPPPSFGSSPNQTYSSQTTYSYVDPQNYVIKESYQSPPINNNGIQTYKTYTSTTSSYVGNKPPPDNQFNLQSSLPFNNNTIQQPIQQPIQQQNQQPTQQPIQQQNQQSIQQPPSSQYINNPQTYIYDFATKTPIAVIPQDNSSSNYSTYSYSSTTNNNNNNNSFGTPKQPLSYAEQLRNQTLTESQRNSNQYQQTSLPERPIPQSFHNIYEERIRSNKQTDQIDELAHDMEMRLRTGRDICSKCNQPIVGDTPGVTALGKPFHVHCFSCDVCNKELAGCSFYNVDGKNLCQVDYMNSLEKCSKCLVPITQKILRALGKAFHPECFVCSATTCNKSLDGTPFTVTKENAAYCLDCYHEQFSPRCAACLKAIAPSGSETEVARVLAMNKSYHVHCYRCEDCGMQLNSKVEGAACYPLEGHLFCKNCNLNRLKQIS